MTCSICNDYKTQIRNAITNRRYEQAEAIKALYVQHLAQAHAGEMVSKPDREQVRAAQGHDKAGAQAAAGAWDRGQ